MKSIKYILVCALAVSTFTSCGQSKNNTSGNSSSIEENKGKFPIEKSDSQWREVLSPQAFEILVKEGTEPAFKNAYYNNHKKGTYVSLTTGDVLFSSDDKFDSGTGWPSFTKPINETAVIWTKDTSYGMTRDGIIEAKTGLHLGHVFNDGPGPTGLRYCINSAAMKFVPAK